MIAQLHAPAHAGSREQATDLLSNLPHDLRGQIVVLDCAQLKISTPSFLDECVKLVLVERNADALDLIDATERTQQQIERSANNRKVSTKVHVALRL